MKRWFKVAACSLALVGLLNGCFGSFGATRFLYNVNKDAHSNVFVQTIIMWCFTVLPAYGAFIFADWLVINIIEYFKGSNPIGNNISFEPQEDGSLLAIGENGESLKFTAVDDNRMIVEHNNTVLGEVTVDGKKSVTMTKYSNADVKVIDLTAAPAM